MSTKNPLPFSNQFERGHSFNWAGKWESGKYYYNNAYVTDFVTFGNCILVCRKDHKSSIPPEIIFVNGIPSDVDGMQWELVNTSYDPTIYQFLSEQEYLELVDTNQVREDVIYYTYED